MADPHDTDEEKTTTTPRRARTSEGAVGKPVMDVSEEDDVRRVELVEIAPAASRNVEGEVLVVRQGGVNVADARQIDIRQGGIGRARADDIAVSQGGIGMARAERVSVELGGVGLAVGNEVRVTQGMAGTVLARDATIEQGGARTIIANHVHLERNVGVFMLLARNVEGNVRTVLDWRGAIAFGAAFGLVVGLVRRRRP